MNVIGKDHVVAGCKVITVSAVNVNACLAYSIDL